MVVVTVNKVSLVLGAFSQTVYGSGVGGNGAGISAACVGVLALMA